MGVDIGTKHAGYIPLSELTDDPTASIEDLVKKGDELELMVVRVNDVEGTVMLSKKRLDAAAGFERVMNAVDTQEVLEGVVTEVIKGGLLVLTHGVKVFVPASHATLSRTDDLSPMLRTKVSFKILEVNRQRRRAVGSIKTVLREERKEKERQFWDTVEVGQKFTGTVKSLTDYGAFIDLGGVDGMVHVSELSWAKIRHPSQVVQVGQEVDVYVRDLDHEKRKISLGYKRDEDNPWNILERDYAVGQDHDVKVVSLTTFGAFAELIPGIDGLIHISQLATHRVGKPSDAVSVGDVVRVRITELDFERKRVSLSIRAVQEDAQATEDAQALADYNATQTEVPDEEAAPAEETPPTRPNYLHKVFCAAYFPLLKDTSIRVRPAPRALLWALSKVRERMQMIQKHNSGAFAHAGAGFAVDRLHGQKQANTIKDGGKLSDVMAHVDLKFEEKYGSAAVPGLVEPIDDRILADFYGLDAADVTDMAGGGVAYPQFGYLGGS